MKLENQILQSDEWGIVKAGFGWEPIKLALSNGASAMLLKRKLPLIKKCFFYVPRGPLIDFDSPDEVNMFVKAAYSEAKKHGALFLRMDPEVPESDDNALRILKTQGFVKARKEVQPRSTFILDLSPTLEKIRAGFESKFRYNIHIAEKHGITIKQGTDEKSVEDFYKIYKETCSRQNFIIHPLSYYQKIRSSIIAKGLGQVFTAYHEQVPVASVIVFNFGKRIWYMYGASLNSYRNMMPNNLLHWEIIKWAKEKGFKEYDLWGIPSNPKEGHPLWGVYRFKKGFNGTLFKFIGSYDLPFNGFLYRLFDKAIILYQNTVRLIKKGTISDSLSE
ncbi:MAG: peptidoglycan bridge formation glycyltransferase FemA/FemB family protein [Candidatus Margulisiibacteriota bacterium]